MEAFEKDVCFSTFPFYGRAFLLAPRVYSDRRLPLSKDWNIVTGHRWLNPSKMLFIYSTEYVSEFASLHNEGLTKVKHPRLPVGISDSFHGVIWDTHEQRNKDLILDIFPTSVSVVDILLFPEWSSLNLHTTKI